MSMSIFENNKDSIYFLNLKNMENVLVNFNKKKEKIPKIIHQIWMDIKYELNPSPNIPENYISFSQKWKNENKDYLHILWNGYTMDKFIKENYKDYYDLYISFPKWIYRCDMFRYIILNKYGGVYLDMDFVCVKSLPIWDQKLILFSDCKPNIKFCGINNCILVSEAQNYFWIDVLNNIKKRFNENPLRDLVEVTGPNLLTDISKKYNEIYIERNSKYFFGHHYTDRDNGNQPIINKDTIGYHLWDFSWKDAIYYTNYNKL